MASKRTANVNEVAQTIERSLRDIRAIMRRPLEAEFSRGQLTGPQHSVMQAVFQSDGISLKELCSRVGLAHSTVSGIVDRLQARGMLERKAGDDDRRLTIIGVTPAVRDFLANQAPRLAVLPLANALSRATSAEQVLILRGLKALQRILEAAQSRPNGG
jgi:MarR family transcriptional regulator, organic hydroperoxide resistance regulator